MRKHVIGCGFLVCIAAVGVYAQQSKSSRRLLEQPEPDAEVIQFVDGNGRKVWARFGGPFTVEYTQ